MYSDCRARKRGTSVSQLPWKNDQTERKKLKAVRKMSA